MTIKEMLTLMCDASEAGDQKVGFYRPAVTNVSRRKNGDTTFTLKLVVAEFTPEDVMLDDLVLWLAVGKRSRVRELEAEAAKAGR